MLNVPMPESQAMLNGIGIVLILIGCISIAYAAYTLKHKSESYFHVLRDWILYSLIFILGTAIPCIPWLIKNVNEVVAAKIENPTIGNYLA